MYFYKHNGFRRFIFYSLMSSLWNLCYLTSVIIFHIIINSYGSYSRNNCPNFTSFIMILQRQSPTRIDLNSFYFMCWRIFQHLYSPQGLISCSIVYHLLDKFRIFFLQPLINSLHILCFIFFQHQYCIICMH